MPVAARQLSAALAVAAIAGSAAADLYRWVDPETGSVKYSSYPPPWYGDPRAERRAPKVEVIPSRATRSGAAVASGTAPAPVAAAPAAQASATPSAATGTESVAALEARRRQALEALRLAAAGPPDAPPPPELAKRMQAYAALLAELDRLDPQGAAARRAETQAALEAIAPVRGAPR